MLLSPWICWPFRDVTASTFHIVLGYMLLIYFCIGADPPLILTTDSFQTPLYDQNLAESANIHRNSSGPVVIWTPSHYLSSETYPLARTQRDVATYSPPRILPDLPALIRFFDRTGLEIRCRAAGNPPPIIRWFSLPSSVGARSAPGTSQNSAAQGRNAPVNRSLQLNDDSSELGFSGYLDETFQADQVVPVEIRPSAAHRPFEPEEISYTSDKTKSNEIVVGDGWLNFTAAKSSTMRAVFFCQAENYLGRVRSRKMVVHQVPMPDENLRIIYTTFPIEPSQKAVVSCHPEQGIFNRFLKVNYWEVYLNGTLTFTVDRSFGRFSMINVTKHPELHIRSVTEDELAGLEVRCILQSIVDESVKVDRPERGRLQRLQFGFSYTELRSVGAEVNVLRGSTVELPWAVEGEAPVGVDWFYLNDASRTRHAIALGSTTAELDTTVNTATSLDRVTTAVGRKARFLPWGTEYELVDGPYSNLRLINLSVADSGHYVAESTNAARVLRVKYVVRVRASLGVKLTPTQRTVDWGSRVELTCEIVGHPRQLVYWLHNAHVIPRRHHLRTVSSPSSDQSLGETRGLPETVSERLIIEAFTLEDVGVYQCIAENGHSAERLALGVSSPGVTYDKPVATARKAGSTEDEPLDSNITPSSPTLTASAEGVGDLIDNAQATALLMMGKMRPSLSWQHPTVEAGSRAAQVLLSIHSGVTDVTLECRFAANPVPNIVWYRDDQPVPLDLSGVISPEVFADNTTAYTTVTRLTVDIRRVTDLNDLWTFGGEYCAVAKNPYGQADCRTYLLLETALRLRPISMQKPAIAGRAYTLKCYFIGNGIPTLQWHRIKSGRDVQRIPVDHRHQLLEDGRVLRITEVNQEEDEADYRCTAVLGDRTANMTVTLKVSHAPRLFELPQTRQVKYTRDMLSYSCALQNRADKPWYAWWEFQREGTNAIVPLPPFKKNTYNGFSVSYVDDMTSRTEDSPWRLPDSLRDKVPSFVHAEPNAAVHVTVNKLSKELHHGNLTCVVLNEVGEDRQSIRVTFIPELEFAIRPPNNQDVTLGQTIAIDCAAKPSDLDPVVDWKYLQKTTNKHVSVSELSEATNGRIKQLANGTLLLSSVDESDPREFLCFLKPGRLSTAAQRSSAVNLEVHVPARIDPLDHVEKVRGSRFNLTCSVHGDPDDLQAAWYYRPTSLWKWQLIDKPCVVPTVFLNEAALRVDGTMNPAKFDASATLSSSGDSSINPSHSTDHVSSLVDCQSYAVEGLESGVLFRQASFFKSNKRGLDKQLQFFSVKEAHMGEYLCRASNKYNRDAFGTRTEVEEFVRLTVISVPGPVNIVYNSSQTTATTVSFSWLPPSQTGNKPIRKYRIRYSHSEPSPTESSMGHKQQPNTTDIEVDATARRIDLKDLRPYTMYRITVVAINDVGPSEESVLPLTTQEAKPSGPVRQLTANGTASDTIVVNWENPAPEHSNGNVDRYWICRQRINGSLSSPELAQLPWPDESADHMTNTLPYRSASTVRGRYGSINCAKVFRQRDYEVTGLPKFTAYAFRVIAMNSKGASPPAFVQARTLEDLPQAPPSDVTCASQQHSITVSWNPPDPDTINGILTEYHVNYFTANVYGDETSSINQAVKGQTTVTLAGLLAYTNYTIQVAVSNRKGRGPASPRIICLTKEAPPVAPDQIKARTVNDSCVVISWSHPRKPQGMTREYCLEAVPLMNGPRDGFIDFLNTPYTDKTRGSHCVRPDFSTSYNHYVYCGLVDQRAYNVSVRAINQFEGHKAWTGPIRPSANPPLSIISIGEKITAQNRMRVTMDCLVIAGYQPQWTYPRNDLENIHVFDNGTLLIESVRLNHGGKYTCSVESDSINYELLVQEISEDPPRKPIWHKFTPSLRGIQAEWLSPGSKRLDAPILWFYLNWTNLYTGSQQTVQLPANQRTYYLSNLTCATTVRFQLRAANKVGNSSLTDVTSWTTLGSAPQAANAAQLVPSELRHQTSVTFNLSSFLPGAGCQPLEYRLLIAPAEDGHFGLKQAVINQTLTRADLITLEGAHRERCCYNVTQLNAGAHYHYKVVATNAAGSASVQGQFWTLTVFGREPVLRQTHILGQPELFQQPTVIVPIAALFAIILVVLIALPFFCRHRRLEESLRTGKEVTQCRNDLRSGTDGVDQYQQHEQHQRLLNLPYHPYRTTDRSGRSTLPPVPGQPLNSQASTIIVPSRSNQKKSGGVAGWFAGTRARLYDRGRTASRPEPPAQSHTRVEEDRLSTNSIDSEGNINPYATYAASGFPELTGTMGTTGGVSNKPPNDACVGVSVSGACIDPRTLGMSYGHPQRAVMDSRMGTSWNTAYNRNLRGPPDSLITPSGHHYHYPNLEMPIANSTVGRPRLVRVGSANRLHTLPGFIDPRLLTPSTAALIDPMMAPYDNSTLGGDLDDDTSRISVIGPMHVGLQRRVNSFESLHRIPRGLSQTYHRGFAVQLPGRSLMPATVLGPDGTLIPVAGPMGTIVSFYDSTKHIDPAVAYRGSVMSSTTASSNQDELMQAYEYGRKHQSRVGGPAGINVAATGTGFGSRLPIASERTPTVMHPGVTLGGDASGGSGSSDATDSGIRQFTQQPPQPDEARLAACEVPAMYDCNRFVPHRSRPPAKIKFPLSLATADHRLAPTLQQTETNCHPEMRDTYSSVDYNGVPYGAPGASSRSAMGQRNNLPQRAIYGAGALSGPTSTRTRQPLPALPSPSTLAYSEDLSSNYAPTYGNSPQGLCNSSAGTHPALLKACAPMPNTGRLPLSATQLPRQGTGLGLCRSGLPSNMAVASEHGGLGRGNRPQRGLASGVAAAAVYGTDSSNPTHNNRLHEPSETSEENVYTSEFVL
ncbi:unnamed protein product, partial [Dicrocoelium dendriticum]